MQLRLGGFEVLGLQGLPVPRDGVAVFPLANPGPPFLR